MAQTTLDTHMTAEGITYTLPDFGLIATARYSGMGGWNVEFAPGKPDRFANKLLAATTDVGDETCGWLALVVACEIARDMRYAGERVA